jgi:F-type H+-transporting ATPase subunit alpha
MKSEHSALMDTINKTGDFSDDIKQGMKKALETFTQTHSW